MKPNYQTQPLTDTELNYLLLIYRKRLRSFLSTFSVLLAIAAYFGVYFANVIHTNETTLSILLHAGKYFLFPGGPVILFGGFIYYKRIYAFKADAANGLKEMIPYVIQEKEYFSRTTKFFFRIDDPENLHYEIDEETFVQHNEGDVIYVSRAPLSKYTFEYGGRFTLM